jgi:hypothetical protein
MEFISGMKWPWEGEFAAQALCCVAEQTESEPV